MPFFTFRRRWSSVREMLQLPQHSSGSLHALLDAEREKTRAALEALQQTQEQFAAYKKRAEKRQAEARTAGVIAACSQLIGDIDDMTRAFEMVPKDLRGHPWLRGMHLATAGFAKTLKGLGLVRFTEPMDQPAVFDPFRYHAIAVEFRPDLAEGTILRVIQPGYLFRVTDGSRIVQERLLRPAHVLVSTQTLPTTQGE
jgi:molecular chaperone GrpE (heat shock protein)